MINGGYLDEIKITNLGIRRGSMAPTRRYALAKPSSEGNLKPE